MWFESYPHATWTFFKVICLSMKFILKDVNEAHDFPSLSSALFEGAKLSSYTHI